MRRTGFIARQFGLALLALFWCQCQVTSLDAGVATAAPLCAPQTVEPDGSEPRPEPKAAQPEWFQSGSRMVGEVEVIGVSIEGQATMSLAERELLEQLRRAILERLGFDRPEDPQVLPELSRRFIREQLLVRDHLALFPYQDEVTLEASRIEGRMPLPYYRGFAEARLTPELRKLVERWKQLPALRDSLRWIGVGSLGVLGSIAILFGYLKADHLSHSHYTRRFQMLALLALTALSGLVVWLM